MFTKWEQIFLVNLSPFLPTKVVFVVSWFVFCHPRPFENGVCTISKEFAPQKPVLSCQMDSLTWETDIFFDRIASFAGVSIPFYGFCDGKNPVSMNGENQVFLGCTLPQLTGSWRNRCALWGIVVGLYGSSSLFENDR